MSESRSIIRIVNPISLLPVPTFEHDELLIVAQRSVCSGPPPCVCVGVRVVSTTDRGVGL